jgi:hypothetical protein
LTECRAPARRPSAHAAAASLADSDDEVHMYRIPPRSALVFVVYETTVLCDIDDEVIVLSPLLSGPSSTSHPIVRPHPGLQACGCGRCPLWNG